MQTAAGILVFLLIIAAAAWLFKPSKASPPPGPEVDDGGVPTEAGVPEGATPAAPPTAGPCATTQDTGGGPVPVKPV